ncbi:hypothetical protein H112_05047 [Trichophyton rubrum D6]|uniref:Uncharacterized protein n=3 Tax=Trichophyton TaxID=5550 RepID=A0A080WFB7_TRIRC|nr:uncharacterized protein TERG_11899 [Trichophyton rubrum CBS 118892]EZF21873.1 hypothetical protein H100_05070 [Trichophyton rubrum MR850]EZF41044.1 hypothetical protein H102_05056 [Trichophyton rubrum CBS 100081]EZF51550.1 hypothetical protein H103_05058 [Trichophyton rubrum CBS 288.86]EZF62295.1 hypothetical protein H104_05051 [Trichophyton rubrum CBS 289.86]EZF72794.1 hypothetical protein H105_05077 [Trichophyton soudanense CBS 452.61]EZF83510.1 hypothetical protein H110_05057 [Trichophy
MQAIVSEVGIHGVIHPLPKRRGSRNHAFTLRCRYALIICEAAMQPHSNPHAREIYPTFVILSILLPLCRYEIEQPRNSKNRLTQKLFLQYFISIIEQTFVNMFSFKWMSAKIPYLNRGEEYTSLRNGTSSPSDECEVEDKIPLYLGTIPPNAKIWSALEIFCYITSSCHKCDYICRSLFHTTSY